MTEPAPLPYDQDPAMVLTIDPRFACACGAALQLFSLYYGQDSIYVLPPNAEGGTDGDTVAVDAHDIECEAWDAQPEHDVYLINDHGRWQPHRYGRCRVRDTIGGRPEPAPGAPHCTPDRDIAPHCAPDPGTAPPAAEKGRPA